MNHPVIVTAFYGDVVGHDAANGRRLFVHAVGERKALGGFARIIVKAIELLVTDTRIFAVAAGSVHCFEYPSGRPIGVATLTGDQTSLRPTMLLSNDRILIGLGSLLHCLDLNGTVLWTAPAYGENLLYGNMAIAVPGDARQQDVEGT